MLCYLRKKPAYGRLPTYLDHVANLEVEHVVRHVAVGVDLDHQVKVALGSKATTANNGNNGVWDICSGESRASTAGGRAIGAYADKASGFKRQDYLGLVCSTPPSLIGVERARG